MADVIGQHEISDNEGSTVAYSGTATTTPANVPSVAGNPIADALVIATGSNLQVSYDGGTTYLNYPKNASIAWNVKGEITQLSIKSSTGTCDYAVLLNLEAN